MRTRLTFVAFTLLAGLLFAVSPQPAGADHGMPPLDPSKIEYDPIGFYGPPDEAGTPHPMGESAMIPNPSGGPPPLNDPNPSGKWIAYDTNVWESLTMPYRHPGDNCNSLPADDRHVDCLSGDLDDDASDPVTRTGYTGYAGPHAPPSAIHGTCPPSPEIPGPWGQCFNNQLEYLDYYEHSMETSFADLGMIVKRYPFQSPGAATVGVGRGEALAASGGQAYNITATIPGADHPEETVLVGAHYDFTDSGPAAAWDSAEGHTEVMRMAYIMADYYRKTGTRPSATLKFVPWDSEESGSHGSQHYVDNNIPPGETDQVRAYFNVDPCAGAYPAFEENTNTQRTQVMQLANPANWNHEPEIKARMDAFNATAEDVIDQVLDRLDDTISRPGVGAAAEVPIFVSDAEAAADGPGGLQSDRGKIVTAVGGLALFTSDYANFEEVGIPVFNFFPDYFGPHADAATNPQGSANSSTKGLEILHTNNDNLRRLNQLTSSLEDPQDPTLPNLPDLTEGLRASEGWAKGMEFCAQVEAWGMLQPGMAGAQTADTSVVAYFEALPNEVAQRSPVTFDAMGTYQYSDVGTRSFRPDNALTYEWDFGDGTKGAGKNVDHAYSEIGRYQAKLTVTGAGGAKDSMTIPVVVTGSSVLGPVLSAIPPADAEDGNFGLTWEFEGQAEGFQNFQVQESLDYRQLFADDASNLEANWTTNNPGGGLQPWQHSDSATEKFFGNQFHSEPRSYWTGVSPEDFPSGPVGRVSILTMKNSITIPTGSAAELSYWSLFRNQSVDSARVQVALTAPGLPAAQHKWDTVDAFQDADNTCVGDSPEAFLPSDFTNRRVDLSQYRGKEIKIRFVYALGASNPALSHPCGWYIDDISVFTGRFSPLADTKETSYTVTGRPNGLWAYRVVGVYNDDILTSPSNVELADVKKSRKLPQKQLKRCMKFQGYHQLGTNERDKIKGTDQDDVICTFGGKDRASGAKGDDVLLAGSGNDKMSGGKGRDLVDGEAGRDKLKGRGGKDRLTGKGGADFLSGGGSRDKCRGGPGKNRLRSC